MKNKKQLPISPKKALEQIAKLRKTANGSNESIAIQIARDALEIQGENFTEYDSRKPLGIDTLITKRTSKDFATNFLQDVEDCLFSAEAMLLPDDIETKKQYNENRKRVIKELVDALTSKTNANPRNVGIALTAVGLALISTSQNI